MADLKKLRPVTDDEPPQPDTTTGNLDQPPRSEAEGTEPRRVLHFTVPVTTFDAFSARAHEEFGHERGAKLKLFHAMWEAYSRGK